MKVRRIVSNTATSDFDQAKAFYGDILGLEPVSEPWGMRRFYVRDPFGKLVNILQHE